MAVSEPTCPECEGRRVERLSSESSRFWYYRCVGDCKAWGYTASDRQFKVSKAAVNREAAAREREHQRCERWLARYTVHPRRQSLELLRPSAETKRAWAAVRSAKTRPALIRRAQVWLDLLATEVCDLGPHSELPVRWRYNRDGRPVQSRSWSSGSAPTIELRPERRRSYLRGQYVRSLVEGRHSIELSDHADLTDMRLTLVHEAQHYLDHATGVDDRGHNHRWRARLARLEAIFPA